MPRIGMSFKIDFFGRLHSAFDCRRNANCKLFNGLNQEESTDLDTILWLDMQFNKHRLNHTPVQTYIYSKFMRLALSEAVWVSTSSGVS